MPHGRLLGFEKEADILKRFAGINPCLLVLVLPLFASARSYHQSSFTVAGGVNSFESPAENQWGNNSGFAGRIEFLHRIGIPIGPSISLGYDFCPICDVTGGEYVASYSLVAQLIPAEYPFQLLTGLGMSRGNDPITGGTNSRFRSLNFPVIARLLYRYRIGNAYIATGAELSLSATNRNNVISLMLPIQWGVW